MNDDIHLSSTEYGMGSGLFFFLGYIVFQVRPVATLLLELRMLIHSCIQGCTCFPVPCAFRLGIKAQYMRLRLLVQGAFEHSPHPRGCAEVALIPCHHLGDYSHPVRYFEGTQFAVTLFRNFL